jgi:hypothetical protein
MVEANDTTEAESTDKPTLERVDELEPEADATALEASIHGDTFEVPIRHVEGVVDEARLQFSSHGVYTKAVEPNNVAMIRMFLPNSMFEDYGLLAIGTEGVDVSHLGKALRGFKTRKRDDDLLDIEISHNRVGDKVFEVSDVQDTREQLTVIRANGVRREPTVPDLDFAAALRLGDGNELREFVKGLPKKGVVTVTASSRTATDHENVALTFEHKIDESDSKHPSERDYELQETLVVDDVDLEAWVSRVDEAAVSEKYHGDDALDAHSRGEYAENRAHVRANYSVEYLKLWSKRLRKTRTEGVSYTLKFGHEWPLKLARDDETPAVVEFLLAPRIMNS